MKQKEESKKQGEFVRGLPVRPVIGDPAKKERPSGMVVVRLAAEASPVERGRWRIRSSPMRRCTP